MRILTWLGILFAILAVVFYFANIAGQALLLLVIASVLCVGLGLATNR